MTKTNKVFPRGMIQALAAKHMTAHDVRVSKQTGKEKAIAALHAELGDETDKRARQVINWLLSPGHRNDHTMKDLKARLKKAA